MKDVSRSLSALHASPIPLQLEKVYDPKNEEDDMREMEEERLRMREHVMKNVSKATLWGEWAAGSARP